MVGPNNVDMFLTVPNLMLVSAKLGVWGEGVRGDLILCALLMGLFGIILNFKGVPCLPFTCVGGLGAKLGLPWLITGLMVAWNALIFTPLPPLLSVLSNETKFTLLFDFRPLCRCSVDVLGWRDVWLR